MRFIHESFVTVTVSLVSLVDDDDSVRESLPELLSHLNFAVRSFTTAEEFLASDSADQTRCLILDVVLPGMSGPDLQRGLKRRGQKIPIVFISGFTDETFRNEMLAQGAVEYLFKPFSEAALLTAINAALGVS
jgi:FixJ family two-component response regulator